MLLTLPPLLAVLEDGGAVCLARVAPAEARQPQVLAPPAVRVDTSLAKFKERAYSERATSYLWAPYSQFHLVGNAALSDRRFSGGDNAAETIPEGASLASLGGANNGDVFRRPFLAAYMSSDCRGHRETFFAHLQRRASLARNQRDGVSQVHALGACSRTHPSPPREKTGKVYNCSRFSSK